MLLIGASILVKKNKELLLKTGLLTLGGPHKQIWGSAGTFRSSEGTQACQAAAWESTWLPGNDSLPQDGVSSHPLNHPALASTWQRQSERASLRHTCALCLLAKPLVRVGSPVLRRASPPGRARSSGPVAVLRGEGGQSLLLSGNRFLGAAGLRTEQDDPWALNTALGERQEVHLPQGSQTTHGEQSRGSG